MKTAEGKTQIETPARTMTKKAEAFYNPNASLQRHIAIAFLLSLKRSALKIADVTCGTGVRSARFLNELPSEMIKKIYLVDENPIAVKYASLNVNDERAEILNMDANAFLHSGNSFDYIEVDPFGSPAPFLDSAAFALKKGGMLAITATDLAALCGSAVRACRRKYWAEPLLNEFKHETGIRILIRRAQLSGAQYEKALIPIYCHATEHYYRVYFREEGSVSEVLKQHKYIHYCHRCCRREVSPLNFAPICCATSMKIAGPLFIGRLWDERIADDIAKITAEIDAKAGKLAQTISEESKIDAVGTYSLPKLASKSKKKVLKMTRVLSKVKGAKTHFEKQSIRTKSELSDVKAASAD